MTRITEFKKVVVMDEDDICNGFPDWDTIRYCPEFSKSGTGNKEKMVIFRCPCQAKCHHTLSPRTPTWSIAYEAGKITVSPSILTYQMEKDGHFKNKIVACHIFLRENKVEFCGDMLGHAEDDWWNNIDRSASINKNEE